MTGSQGKRTTHRMKVLAPEFSPRKLNAMVPIGSLSGIHSQPMFSHEDRIRKAALTLPCNLSWVPAVSIAYLIS